MSVIDFIRGPATSPFSQQPKYQGNKNSFGLATGPPLQQQQQQAPTQQPPTVSAATNGDHQVPVTAAAGDSGANNQQLDQVELEVNESIIGAVIGPQVSRCNFVSTFFLS